jgi:capsular exopolysaccharide synthesis family protein
MRPQLPPAGDPSNLPAVQQVYSVPPSGWYGPGPDYDPEPPGVPLSHYLWILRRHKWKILSFVAASVIATLIVSYRLTPIYESTATIDVDRRMPSGIVGQEADQYSGQDSAQFLATQVQLIQSDSVIRPVVRRYKLDEPPPGEEKKPLPANAADAPVKLENLKVTQPANTYLVRISYRSANPALAAAVANGIAQSYIEHTYNIRYRASAGLSTFMEKQIEELRAKMERSSAALAQFERELNVVNPEEKTNILSARLLQLNTEYTQAQSDRVAKEAAYNSIKTGSIDAAQVSSQGESFKRVSERLADAQEKFAVAEGHFGQNHPEYRKAAVQVRQLEAEFERLRQSVGRRVEVEYRQAVNREGMLRKAVAETKAEADSINARSFEYQAFKREADADKNLYEELTRKIKEAGINAGFQNSAIRLADPARPGIVPVFPNIPRNAALAFVLSAFLALGAAVLSDRLDNTIRDPEQVERLLGTEVVGNLPLVKDWRKKKLLAAVPKPPSSGQAEANGLSLVPVAAEDGATLAAAPKLPEGFYEAIHTLRSSILLRAMERPLRSIMVTSAAPGEGKTTTAVHLAIAHAEYKHRTLLIDADLRRPAVAQKLGLSDDAGLSTVLNDGMLWREKLVQLDGLPSLDILPAGPASRSSVHLLGRGLPEILEEAARHYELIIVDAPPLHGFAEPLQMAAQVDGVVLVTLPGHTNRKAVGAVVSSLRKVQANVLGIVLNAVSKNTGSDYGYFGSYGYYGKPLNWALFFLFRYI